MPIYEYKCLGCGKRHEIIQRFSDDPVRTCPDCGGVMEKMISSNSFVLKGSGWYSDGYSSPTPEKAADKTPKKKPAPEKAAGKTPEKKPAPEKKAAASSQ